MDSLEPSRKSCPTEKRLIMREALTYYNSLLVAGIYHFPEQNQPLSDPAFYFPALKKCVETHSMLAAVVKDATTANESYKSIDTVNLHNHVHVLHKSLVAFTEDETIAKTIEHIQNDPDLAVFKISSQVPRWRIDVLPLDTQRVIISFTYSHCVGDGMSGAIFHKTFLEALNSSHPTVQSEVSVSKRTLPVLPHLPVSLPYLLGPALGHYLPKFLSQLLGVVASTSGSDDETWIGPVYFDNRISPDVPVQTAVEVFSVSPGTLSKVLAACRRHQTKLTALLNELIALCISRKFPNYCDDFTKKPNLVACIPTNLRKAAGISENVIGNIASATYSKHPVTSGKLSVGEDVWSRARLQSTAIAKSVVSLKDQPIGLLAWISNIRSWTEEKIGHERDSSWQLSNLMAFDAGDNAVTIDKIFFSQPADATGISLNFNTISLKGGELVICVSWQVGAVGLNKVEGMSVEDKERDLVSGLLRELRECLDLAAETRG